MADNPSKAIKRHHRFVKQMKFILTAVAALLGATLLLWPQIAKQRDFIDNVLKSSVASFSKDVTVDMTKVQFFSEDRKGQPFVVTSSKVLETDPAENKVKLDEPIAKMTLNSGVQMTTTSPYAFFFQNKEVLYFEKEVLLTSDNGYRASLSRVAINNKEKSANSPDKVSVKGPKGSLVAQGFNLFDNGDKIDFLGRSMIVVKDDAKNRTFVITGDDGISVRQTERTVTARKNASLTQEKNKLFADEIVALIKTFESGQYELENLTAVGQVKIQTPTETITGEHAFYDTAKEEAIVKGHVVVTRREGAMEGDRVTVDMKTGASRMTADPNADGEKGRVRGFLLPAELKNGKVAP